MGRYRSRAIIWRVMAVECTTRPPGRLHLQSAEKNITNSTNTRTIIRPSQALIWRTAELGEW